MNASISSISAPSRAKVHRPPRRRRASLKNIPELALTPVKLHGLGGEHVPAFHVAAMGMLLAALSFNSLSMLSQRTVSRVLAEVSIHTPIASAYAAQVSTPIRLEDGSGGVIIGQFAKIPSHNEDITEVRSASAVDKKAAHELLSIIAKY